jgi:hypothetical protein
MAWDVRVTYVNWRGTTVNLVSWLYKAAFGCFIHHLLPSCDGSCKKLPHIQISLSQPEIHNVFETINFSQVNVQGRFAVVALVGMYIWLLFEVGPNHLFTFCI